MKTWLVLFWLYVRIDTPTCDVKSCCHIPTCEETLVKTVVAAKLMCHVVLNGMEVLACFSVQTLVSGQEKHVAAGQVAWFAW